MVGKGRAQEAWLRDVPRHPTFRFVCSQQNRVKKGSESERWWLPRAASRSTWSQGSSQFSSGSYLYCCKSSGDQVTTSPGVDGQIEGHKPRASHQQFCWKIRITLTQCGSKRAKDGLVCKPHRRFTHAIHNSVQPAELDPLRRTLEASMQRSAQWRDSRRNHMQPRSLRGILSRCRGVNHSGSRHVSVSLTPTQAGVFITRLCFDISNRQRSSSCVKLESHTT